MKNNKMEISKSNIEIINRLHQLSWLKKQDHLDKFEETMGKHGKRNHKRHDQKSSKKSNSYPVLVEEKKEPEVEQVLNPASNVWLKDDSASAAAVLFPEAVEKNNNCNLDEDEQIEMAVMLSMIVAEEEGYESPTKIKVKNEGYVVIDDDGDNEWGEIKGNLPTESEASKPKIAAQENTATKTNLPRESLEDFHKRLLLNPRSCQIEEVNSRRKMKQPAQEDQKKQISKKEEKKKVAFSSEVMDEKNESLNKYPISLKPMEMNANIDDEEDFSFVKPAVVLENVKKGLQVIEEEDGTDEEKSSTNGDREDVQNLKDKGQEKMHEVKGQEDIAEEVKAQVVPEEKGLEKTFDLKETEVQEEILEEVKDQVVSEEKILKENSDSEVKDQDVLPNENDQEKIPIFEVKTPDAEIKVQDSVPEENDFEDTIQIDIIQDSLKNAHQENPSSELETKEQVSEENICGSEIAVVGQKEEVQPEVPDSKIEETVQVADSKDEETPEEVVTSEENICGSEIAVVAQEEEVQPEVPHSKIEETVQVADSKDKETSEEVGTSEENICGSEIAVVGQEEEVQPEVPDSKIEKTVQVADSKDEETLEKVGTSEEKICEEQISNEISEGELTELKYSTIQNESKVLEMSSGEREETAITETNAETMETEKVDDQKKQNLEENEPSLEKELEQQTPEQKKEEETAENVSRESRIPTRSRPICRVQNSDEGKNSFGRENSFGFNKNAPRHSTMFPRDNQRPSTMFPKDGRHDSRRDSREPRRHFRDSGGPFRDSRPSRDSELTEPKFKEPLQKGDYQQGREPRSNFRDSRQFRDNDSREPRGNYRDFRQFRDNDSREPRGNFRDSRQIRDNDSREPRGNFRDSRTFRETQQKPRENQDAQYLRQNRESRGTSRDSAKGPRERWVNPVLHPNRCDRQTLSANVEKPQQPEEKGKKDEEKVDLQEAQKVVESPPVVTKIPSPEVPVKVSQTTLSSDSIEFIPNSQQKKENPKDIRPLAQEEVKESPKEQLQPLSAEFVPQQYDRAPYQEYGEASSEAYKMAPSEETYKMTPVYRHPVEYYSSPPPHFKVPQQYYVRPSEYVSRYPHFVPGFHPESLYSSEGYPQGMPNYAFEAPEFPRPPLPPHRDFKNFPRQNLEAANRYHPSQTFEGQERQGFYKQQTSFLGSPPRPPPGFYQRAPPQTFGNVGERRGGPNERSGYADREMMGGCEERPLISPKTLMTTQFEAPPLQLHVREPNPGQGNRNTSRVCASRGRGYSATKVPFPRRYN